MGSGTSTVRAGHLLKSGPRPGKRPADLHILYLRQARDLVRVMDDETYTAETPLLPGGSPGKHLRHCLDFYAAFFRGLPAGRIDYSRRRRDPAVESRRNAALEAIESIETKLASLDEASLHRPVLVRGEEEARGPATWSRSTLLRELHVLLSHTIHHYALMGVIVRTRGIEPPPSFGVSPSTLAYRDRGRLRSL